MLSRTDLMPDGSALTVPRSCRGARLRENTLPFASPASVAVGAVVSHPPAARRAWPDGCRGAVETVTGSAADDHGPAGLARLDGRPSRAAGSVSVARAVGAGRRGRAARRRPSRPRPAVRVPVPGVKSLDVPRRP